MHQSKERKKRVGKYTVRNFELKLKRGLSGLGLFAAEPVPKGACIIEYIGKEVPRDKQKTAKGRYLFETGKDKMIDGNIKENLAKYINHSCKPNCEAVGPSGRVFILSIRRIKPGEELAYDYDTEYFDEYIKPKGCLCVKCKKE